MASSKFFLPFAYFLSFVFFLFSFVLIFTFGLKAHSRAPLQSLAFGLPAPIGGWPLA
jgi:hypothetical protein